MKAFIGKDDQTGAAAIEFALVLPLLLLLLFGTIELGLLLYNKQIITNASREGARAGIVAGGRLTDEEIEAVVNYYCGTNLITFGTENSPVVTPDPLGDRSGMVFGENLAVSVKFNYSFLFLSSVGFDPIELEAKTVMKME